MSQKHCLLVEQAGVRHLDGGFEAVSVGNVLLCDEDIQTFAEQCAAAEVFFLPLAGDLFRVFRRHLRAVNQV